MLIKFLTQNYSSRVQRLVVMKTSEVTPLPAYKFAELVKEAGFPPVSVTKKSKHFKDI